MANRILTEFSSMLLQARKLKASPSFKVLENGIKHIAELIIKLF